MIHPRTTPSARGFTLVETLVAIAILMIAIVGPFYMLQQAITAANTARDQLIASALAQEGVEYAYFVRNNNFLAGRTWNTSLTGCSGTAGCSLDTTQNALTTCASSGCSPLNLSGTRLYVMGAGTPTRFTRSVRIEQTAANQMTVRVTVQWSTNRAPYTIQVVEHLYNWL